MTLHIRMACFVYVDVVCALAAAFLKETLALYPVFPFRLIAECFQLRTESVSVQNIFDLRQYINDGFCGHSRDGGAADMADRMKSGAEDSDQVRLLSSNISFHSGLYGTTSAFLFG